MDLLIVGTAPGWELDSTKWLDVQPVRPAICLINRAIYLWPGHADIAASLHADLMPGFLQARTGAKIEEVWAGSRYNFDHQIGTSAHFAYLIARSSGRFAKIHLAGVALSYRNKKAIRNAWLTSAVTGELDLLGDIISKGWLQTWRANA